MYLAVFLVFALAFGTMAMPEKAYANPYGGGDGNCTYTAWRLAYANTGVSLPGWRNACTWYESARNAGYTVSTVPRERSIAVWSGGPGGLGHVAYVARVSGDQIYIQEGGYDGGYHEGWENAYGRTKYYNLNFLTMTGYIYLGNTAPSIQGGYLNLGQSFRASISRADVQKNLTVNGDNVELSSENLEIAKQVWHFERQGDGSYIITSIYDGRALDVTGAGTSDGTNVGVYTKWGTDNGAQKWFIYGSQNAGSLVPKIAPDKSLDCISGSAASGTNLGIYQWNGNAAQVFRIDKTDKKPPESVKCMKDQYSVMIGESIRTVISADIEPQDSDYKDLTYSVEDPSIAVMEGGIVRGVAPGSTKITVRSAYNDRLKFTVTVNVSEYSVPDVRAQIREIKEDSIVMYVEAEHDQEISNINFRSGELYNPETNAYLDYTVDAEVASFTKYIRSQSFAGEIEVPARFEYAAGDEHVIIVEACCGIHSTEIVVPYSRPSGVLVPMKAGETMDERTLFERWGGSESYGFRWCFETTDCVSFTKGSMQEGAPDYRNGTYTMNKPGRYSVAYEIRTGSGNVTKRLALTFDIACSHPNALTQGARINTCAEDGYTGDLICTDCYAVIEQGRTLFAKGHAWSDYQTVRKADCVNGGEEERVCANCLETEKKQTPARGHVVVKDKAVPATALSTGLTEGSHCGVCGKVLKARKAVPKLSPSQSDTKPVKTQQAGSQASKIEKGRTYRSGKLYYTVLSVTNQEVAAARPAKKTEKSSNIPNCVSINGVTCSVTEIRASAFQNNKKLRSVTIGKNVRKIGKKAFAGCRSLKKINIKSEKIAKAYPSSIKGIAKTAVINVPNRKIKAYKALFGIKKKSGIRMK